MSFKIKVQQIKRSLVIFIAIYTLNSKNICISDHNVNVNCQNHLIMNGTFPWMKSEPDCHVTNYPDSFLHVSWSFLINIYSWEKIYTVLIDKNKIKKKNKQKQKQNKNKNKLKKQNKKKKQKKQKKTNICNQICKHLNTCKLFAFRISRPKPAILRSSWTV